MKEHSVGVTLDFGLALSRMQAEKSVQSNDGVFAEAPV